MENKPKWYQNKIERDKAYNKDKTFRFLISLNKATDTDIIEHLEKQDNRQGYIKELIRKDMAK